MAAHRIVSDDQNVCVRLLCRLVQKLQNIAAIDDNCGVRACTAGPPPQPPTLTRPSGSAPPSAPARGLSQPEEIGMVYFWNGRVLIPLERNHAVEHKKSSAQYWEMQAPQSPVRLSEASSLAFILRLPQGVNPATYSLFQLVTVDGSRVK
jgi:hypothetical protein